MRASDRKDGFSVHAISGTRAVLLAMNARPEAIRDLVGFGIGTRKTAGGAISWLNGFKCFEAVHPDPPRGQKFKTVEQPIQDFKWGHYSAVPGRAYTYVIRPLFRPANGDLATLRQGTDLEVTIRTEKEDAGDHSILFNRGVIVSQAYADRFGNDTGKSEAELDAELDDKDADRTRWLSRGLLEGALDFIAQARSGRFTLQCAFYEFTYPPIIQALAEAASAGATVEVAFEAGHFNMKTNSPEQSSQGKANRAAIAAFEGRPRLHFRERTKFISIPHNKFMVLLDNGHPVSVWTGSTNMTASGFCGQSNVGHIVRDEAVAQAYSDYFQLIARDEERKALKKYTGQASPNPGAQLPPNSITPLFSPRSGSSMLDWYGSQMDAARQTILLTSAFGVTTKLAAHFDNDRDYLRYILMEQTSRGKGAQDMLERDRDTRIVLGQGLGTLKRPNGPINVKWEDIPGWKLEKWMLRERSFRNRGHIFFLHTKYMVIDPLTDDPLVFSGSANFSPASLSSNDENMLLIRGNKSVADVYLTEFFRLDNHFYFRQVANQKARDGKSDPKVRYLDPTDKWVAGHFRADNFRCKRRELFGVPA